MHSHRLRDAQAFFLFALGLVVTLAGCATDSSRAARTLSAHDVEWTSPSENAAGSMPMGNGEFGANVWVEAGSGDLMLLLSRTDAISEASRFLKLGRLRVTMTPRAFAADAPFRQRLNLEAGRIEIDMGRLGDRTHLQVYFHPDADVMFITGWSDQARSVRVTLEDWRTERRRLTGSGPDAELTSSWTMRDAPEHVEVWESADKFLTKEPGAITWYHENESSVVPFTLEHQGLSEFAGLVKDPITGRITGGVIRMEGAVSAGAQAIETARSASRFEIVTGTASTQEGLTEWENQVRAAVSHDADSARKSGERWWREFWDRSYIFVSADEEAVHDALPVSSYPIRIGEDQTGWNRFAGEIASVELRAGADLGQAGGIERLLEPFMWIDKPSIGATSVDPAMLVNAFTFTAKVKPAADFDAGRIVDRVTPGGSDGYLFDIQPGGTLRLVVGSRMVTAPGAVRLGEWNNVQAKHSAEGAMALLVDGKEVARLEAGARPGTREITRGYVLQRWMQACAGRGEYPIKFNGSIFTVEPEYTNGVKQNADYRRWGDGYWWQNMRLPLYNMAAAGDTEMMDALMRVYEEAVPICAARAKAYYNAEGVYFPETMTMFGMYANGDYGWNRQGRDRSVVDCPWWMYAWNQGLELVSLMLDRYEYTGDEEFLRSRALPMADQVLRYFDTRFGRDSAGMMVISPTQALETHWHEVVNDMPSVAGLHAVLGRLRALPEKYGSAEERAMWRRMADALPAIPMREEGRKRMLAPAEKYDASRQNVETPELYAVFPFRLCGVGMEGMEEARAAYFARHDKMTHGWTQDGMFAALLGLTDEAKANILAKAGNSNPRHRFPAMWGPNFDWLPDQCHGGNLMTTLQLMLMQCDGETIRLLPAWPKEWDVSFKLRAPRQTTVEVEYRDGEIARLEVTPEARRKDVVVMLEGAAVQE